MDPNKNTVKLRIINGIGLDIIERPRQLQKAARADEHHVVHVLHTLEKQGLVTFRKKRSMHSPGVNLTDIRLTREGIKLWRQTP
jgi:hypothetical protein